MTPETLKQHVFSMVPTTAIHLYGSRLPFFQPFSLSNTARLSNHFIRYLQTQFKDVNTVCWNFLFHSCRLYLKTYYGDGLDSSRKSRGWFGTASRADDYDVMSTVLCADNNSATIPEMAVPTTKVKHKHCQWGSQFLFFQNFHFNISLKIFFGDFHHVF